MKILAGQLITRYYDAIVVPNAFLPDVTLMSILKLKDESITTISLIHHLANLTGRGLSLGNIASYLQQSLVFEIIRKYADYLVVYPHLQRQLKELFPKQKVIATILGGVPDELFQDVDKLSRYLRKPNYFLITYIGAIRPYKRLHYLIDAYRRLTSEVSRDILKLIIAGSAENVLYLRKLIAMANKFKSTSYHVRIIGQYVPERLKTEILGKSRVFVNPSVEEGFSITIAEALLHANKVIVMKELREVVRTYYRVALENNLLLIANDLEDLSEKISCALSSEVIEKSYRYVLEELKKLSWFRNQLTLASLIADLVRRI